MSPAKTPSSDRALALFLDMMAAERSASPNTLAAYQARPDPIGRFFNAARRDVEHS
jgi:site-specific recombinase XerD